MYSRRDEFYLSQRSSESRAHNQMRNEQVIRRLVRDLFEGEDTVKGVLFTLRDGLVVHELL
jgi:hypothetical protein